MVAASGRPVNRAQMLYIASLGIKAVISLTEDPIPEELIKGLGLECYHVPMRNHEMPDDETLERAVGLIASLTSSGKKVLVHCAAGQGRTGTVLAAYLILKDGMSADEAIEKVRSGARAEGVGEEAGGEAEERVRGSDCPSSPHGSAWTLLITARDPQEFVTL
jgi:protein-tyrosine phosphatase